MKYSKLTAAIVAAMAFGCAQVFAADVTSDPTATQDTAKSPQDVPANSSGDASKDDLNKKAKRLDTVIVSGSLINNAQIQTATPTFTITAKDIEARGFNSVAEVLQNSVFSTGTVPGSQTPGFNQGSQTFSFYGLNPEYTLTLLDGKPLSQFGQLYGGVSDFTNIGNIPLSIIDHIDILPGGGSSIYGSQAISGVVNIVTKEHMDGAEVSVRTGNYSLGGGANQRMSLAFGHKFGDLDVLGTLELDNQSPAWYYQRDLTSMAPRPIIVAAMWDYGVNYASPASFQSPPNGCAAISNLFGGTTALVNRTNGSFCGSPKTFSYGTFINQDRSYSGTLKLRYKLNDDARLYADVLTSWQQQKFTAGIAYNWWGPKDLPGGVIEDANTLHVLSPERFFAPEEVGGNNANGLVRQSDLMYQGDVGANGKFGESDWNWDAYYLRSGERTSDVSPLHPAAAVDGFFENILGPVVGVDPNTGYNMYHPNYAAFYSPISTAQYKSFTTNINAKYNTWINNFRGTINNDSLFHLPGGDAGFAWLLEGGNQAWYAPVNPMVANGLIWGNTGVSGGGQRDHYASAFELNMPVLSSLTVDLSGRYDRYTVSNAAANNKFTYKIGLEYRPFSTLLLRGNYATGFIAPDMSSIFLGPSGQYNNVTDYYLCASQGGGQNCSSNYTEGVKINVLPNKKLQPTNSSSFTFGTVWSPLHNLSLSADYLHISINNEIQLQSSDLLMRQESQCRLGQLPSDSAICQSAYGQITRSPYTGQVTNLDLYYVNIANEVTDSVTAEAKYAFHPTRIGTFAVQLDYNSMLKHSYQEYPGTVPINQLTNPLWSTEFKNITTGSLSWSWHDTWRSTLYMHRYSPTPNYIAFTYGPGYPGAGSLPPWFLYNLSVGYSPTKNLDFSLMVNNLLNKMPPQDPGYRTSRTFPYFNNYNYNIYGRQIMLQATYRFGGSR